MSLNRSIGLVAACVSVYALSMFFRGSISVIAPNLSQEFDFTAADLANLSSLFFLSFALAQIPVGIAIDRYGAKSVMLVMAVVMLAGTVIFATAGGATQLIIGRMLTGLGCSSFLMAPLAIYAKRFAPANFASMIGIQMSGGMIGTLATTAPLAIVTAEFGWRQAFLGAAALGAVATVAVVFAVREDAAERTRRASETKTLAHALTGIAKAVRTPWFGRLALMQCVTVAPSAAILGLWGGPWLAHVYGFDLQARGNYLLVLALAQIAGVLLWGRADRAFKSYRIPIMIACTLTMSLLLLAGTTEISEGMLLPFLAALGLCSAFGPAVMAHSKHLFPPDMTARGLTLFNTGQIGGVFLQQKITGYIIDMFPATMTQAGRVYPPEAYRAIFLFVAAELLLALFVYWRAPETRSSG